MTTKAKARSLRPGALWVDGRGDYASISDCPPGSTIYLFKTRAEAEEAKASLDATGCGGKCVGKRGHSIVNLND
jgi:hypothetical protein